MSEYDYDEQPETEDEVAERWTGPDGTQHFANPGELPDQFQEAIRSTVAAELGQQLGPYVNESGQDYFLDAEDYAAAEQREAAWAYEDQLQQAQEAQAVAEQQALQGAALQLEGMLADELERQLDAGEIETASPEALSLIANLAANQDWLRERGLEPGSDKAIKAAIRAGFHADAPDAAPDEEEGVRRWLLRREAGGSMRSEGRLR